MIKNVKVLKSDVLIASEQHRNYITKQVTEINRGIGTLCVLSILNQYGNEGIHGYGILKELSEQTDDKLVIEEGTLYPLLRKLEQDQMIRSRKEKEGRRKKLYCITDDGKRIYNYLTGYYSVLTESVASLFDVKVSLKEDRYIYCTQCSNKIDLNQYSGTEIRFCDACGHNIENELIKRGIKK
ncbi:MAG: PadR family transcriptional regulator [Promethearchaeota archaeon]